MSVCKRYNAVATRRRIIAGDEPPWLAKHPRRSYVRQAYLALPYWQSRDELRWLDWCRRAWSAATGIEHVIDHVIPINHPAVCGLTVVANLAFLTRDANAAKGGKWAPDQTEMVF